MTTVAWITSLFELKIFPEAGKIYFLYVKVAQAARAPQLFWNATILVALKMPAGMPAFRFEIPIRFN